MKAHVVSAVLFIIIAIWQAFSAVMQLKTGEIKGKTGERYKKMYTPESLKKYIRFSSVITIIDSVFMIAAAVIYYVLDMEIYGLLIILAVFLLCPLVNYIYEKDKCVIKHDDEDE